MKVNIILTIISIAVSALLGYLTSILSVNLVSMWVVFLSAFVSFAVVLVPFVGISHEYTGMSVNLKVLSAIGFVVIAISQGIMNAFPISASLYVVISSIIVLLFVGAYYALSRS